MKKSEESVARDNDRMLVESGDLLNAHVRVNPPLHLQPPLNQHGRRWLLCVSPSIPALSVLELSLLEAPGFNPHLPGLRHTFLSKALGATMWFFLFYRVRYAASTLSLFQSAIDTRL